MSEGATRILLAKGSIDSVDCPVDPDALRHALDSVSDDIEETNAEVLRFLIQQASMMIMMLCDKIEADQ